MHCISLTLNCGLRHFSAQAAFLCYTLGKHKGVRRIACDQEGGEEVKKIFSLSVVSLLVWLIFVAFSVISQRTVFLNSIRAPGHSTAAMASQYLLQLLPWLLAGLLVAVFLHRYTIASWMPMFFLVLTIICVLLCMKLKLPLYYDGTRVQGMAVSPPISTACLNAYLTAVTSIGCLRQGRK